MLRTNPILPIWKQKQPIVIGSRFTGKHSISHDLQTGEYSESLPIVQGDSAKIQTALLSKCSHH